ncbi:MAG: hypothetical protein ABFS45_22650 [Pseudomonadota bacterium]
MSDKNPPHAGDICSSCPNPTITAIRKMHFGKPAWELECPYADEIHAVGKGIEIHCSALDGLCCVDNNRDYFVTSPKIYPMRSFLEATLKYLGIKG